MDAFTYVWTFILGVSVSSLPRTTPLRVFFSAWVCYSLAINTLFQAHLTTFLVDPGFEKLITNIEEIFTSGFKYGLFSSYFYRNCNDKTDPKAVEILENRIDCDGVVTCVLWTAKYRNISSISFSAFVEFILHGSKYSDEFGGYQYCGLTETPVLVTDLLMALPKGSPFLDHVNKVIDRLVESGIAAHLDSDIPEAKTFLKGKSRISECLVDEYSVLTMQNMQPPFHLLLFGHCLGLITFLAEILYFKLHCKNRL
jgi:hypothetical protein